MINYNWIALSELLQWSAVVFNLGFLFFMIRERTLAWPLGILGSVIMIYLAYESRIYSESMVYVFYVVMGIYGWYRWERGPEHIDPSKHGKQSGIVRWPLKNHFFWIVIGAVTTFILGTLFNRYTDARFGYLDAFSTVFQLIATYLEARKVLSAWLYWIFLNLFAIWFYARAGLDIVSLQMIVYTIMSVMGYFAWAKRSRFQPVPVN